jgi:hypothetical protein
MPTRPRAVQEGRLEVISAAASAFLRRRRSER